ncbi:CASP-like protein 3A1 [Linum grandiflorum]
MTSSKAGGGAKVPEVFVAVGVTTENSSSTMSSPVVPAKMSSGRRWRSDVMHGTLRLLCLVTSLTSMGFMVTAKQSSSISIFGFMLPLNSNWSFSTSFQYLVGVSTVAAAHSLVQLLITSTRLIKNSPAIQSRAYSWVVFAADQALAYAVISGGAASTGVSNLNRTGIRHTSLPNFCKPLKTFCDHVAVSIGFTFFTFFLLAASAVHQVLWLSNSSQLH